MLLAVVVVVSISLWMYIRYDPHSSSICAACHNMVPFVTNIENTPHGGTSCATCHKLDFLRWIYVQAVENPTPQQIAQRYREPMLAQCLECHSVGQFNSLNIHKAHAALADKLGSCTICHNPHDLASLSANCQTCHAMEKVLTTHMAFHDYAWTQVEMGKYEVCLECHSPWSKWYAPIGPDCQIGVGKGVPCIGCHGPRAFNFVPAQFLDCTKCHGR
ncbi:MAG: cytochrome C [Pyrobaculum arsenaticum]|uniref:cytochrome C n=1 Tax=Pyrobaculum arsenaticum TaxID=121277 RepID=UPI002272C425|nr:cytochrome C [Pyrobaculum arsenaticum]